jgi:hypothetical protein
MSSCLRVDSASLMPLEDFKSVERNRLISLDTFRHHSPGEMAGVEDTS